MSVPKPLTPEREAEIRTRISGHSPFAARAAIDELLRELDRLRAERDAAVKAREELRRVGDAMAVTLLRSSFSVIQHEKILAEWRSLPGPITADPVREAVAKALAEHPVLRFLAHPNTYSLELRGYGSYWRARLDYTEQHFDGATVSEACAAALSALATGVQETKEGTDGE